MPDEIEPRGRLLSARDQTSLREEARKAQRMRNRHEGAEEIPAGEQKQ